MAGQRDVPFLFHLSLYFFYLILYVHFPVFMTVSLISLMYVLLFVFVCVCLHFKLT